jgi:hypothetical protein
MATGLSDGRLEPSTTYCQCVILERFPAFNLSESIRHIRWEIHTVHSLGLGPRSDVDQVALEFNEDFLNSDN